MTTATAANGPLTAGQLAGYDEQGYVIVPGLFGPAEVAALRAKFDGIAAAGKPIPGYWEPDAQRHAAGDPLGRYPRVMHPHRWDDFSKGMLLHPAVGAVLRQLLREEAVACQSMFYFKPPGARGQALHQDNFYVEVRPGTCVACWVAIDSATPENGGLYVVPGTHRLDILCPEVADEKESWTKQLVQAPKGLRAVPAVMQPGDALFFNGSVIHGSGVNRSATQWRRSWICHYMPRRATHVSSWYFPIFDFAGNELTYEAANGGGPCGDAFKPSSYEQIPG